MYDYQPVIKEEQQQRKEGQDSSYSSILKTTSIIGVSKIIVIIMRIVRNKIIAVLLGTEGMGLQGLFTSNLQIVNSITSFGLGVSGVQSIAEANKNNDEQKIAKIAKILRIWLLGTGLLGTAITIILSKQFSIWAFETDQYSIHFIILSVVVLITTITTGETIILNGLRKIKHLAKADVIGTLLGVISTIIIYRIWGIDGVVPAIVAFATFRFVAAKIFTKKANIKPVSIPVSEVVKEGKGMIKIGGIILITTLMAVIAQYLLKIIIAQELGVAEVGLFHAAFFFSTFYLNIILDAMTKDYYPRLVSVKDDKRLFNQYINEQMEVALLLATPVIIIALTFSKYILIILFSKDFLAAQQLFNWMILGSYFMVLNFPLGYSLLAQNSQSYYFIGHTLRFVFLLLIPFIFLHKYGIESVGVAFACALLFNGIFLFWGNRRINNLILVKSNFKIIVISSAFILIVFILNALIDTFWGYMLNTFLFSIMSFISIKKMKNYDIIKLLRKKIQK